MNSGDQENDFYETAAPYYLERYGYILRQVEASNGAVYRFLGIYQTLATTIGGALVGLFVGHQKWELSVSTTKEGLVGLACLLSVVSIFSALMIFITILNWIDYRREECELTDSAVFPGFRAPPRIANWTRWHETYFVVFIILTTVAVWILVLRVMLPNVT